MPWPPEGGVYIYNSTQARIQGVSGGCPTNARPAFVPFNALKPFPFCSYELTESPYLVGRDSRSPLKVVANGSVSKPVQPFDGIKLHPALEIVIKKHVGPPDYYGYRIRFGTVTITSVLAISRTDSRTSLRNVHFHSPFVHHA